MRDIRKTNPASPDPIDVSIGSRLRQRRLSMGISQPALAKSLGITFQQIQKYERGSNRIVASRLYRLSRVLKVPIEYFFQDLIEGDRTQTGTAGREGGGASPERVPDLLAKRDTLGLVRNYNKIEDPDVRRQICALVKTLGEGVSDPDH